MKISRIFILILMLMSMLLIITFACQNKPANRENKHAEGTEESGTELSVNEKYDTVRNGARLLLVYDAPSNAFVGSVANTTDKTLKKVRVEVHLSNGIELGPTTPADLDPGEKMDIKLAATSEEFVGWTAHPEVGGGELGHGDGPGEHEREDSEHKGEHGKKH